MKPFISVCVPVFNTEEYLEEALESINKQTFKNFEVIIVNDGSSNINNKGLSCKKIVKNFKKKSKIKTKYIEHSVNKGLVEARRSALYEAKGEYIFFFDSDDLLTPNCIQDLVNVVQVENYDVVQGSFEMFPSERKRQIPNFYGLLQGDEIFRNWLVKKKISSFLWAKLIKREILLEAFDLIPPVFCNVGEDFLIWFFVTRFANSFFGMENVVYKYRQNSGMTSRKIINNEEHIKMIASTASVFAIIYNWLNEQKNVGTNLLSQEELQVIYDTSCKMLRNNLLQIEENVIPELKDCAYQIMCDFWGKDFVDKVEELRK